MQSGFSMIVSSLANDTFDSSAILGGLPSKEKRTSEMRKLNKFRAKSI